MQSEAEDIIVEFKASRFSEDRLNPFQLYEEYSKESIVETIRTRKENFEKANRETRRRLEKEVDLEIEAFCTWLRSAKDFEPLLAHHYSISLKSLLFGIPTGIYIACFFQTILNAKTEQHTEQ